MQQANNSISLLQISSITNICFNSENYLSNYPQIFKEQNSPYFFYEHKENEVASFCSIFPINFYQKELNLKVSAYCIGSVCTRPQYRGQGLASKLLQKVIFHCKQKLNPDFILLFGQDHHIYKQLGFELCGKIYFTELTKHQSKIDEIPINQDLLFEKIDLSNENSLTANTIKSWEFILNHQTSSESILSFTEFTDILKIKEMILYILKDKNNIIKSLCFLNKGDDFKNTIHGLYFKEKRDSFEVIKRISVLENTNPLYFFPGQQKNIFESLFIFDTLPNMFVLETSSKIPITNIKKWVENDLLFVNSLQST